MLHDAHRTSAPSAASVSMRTAVWMVMWRLPVIRCPCKGCAPAYSLRMAMRPGISCSARTISLRPHSARPRSATLNSKLPCLAGADIIVVMFSLSFLRSCAKTDDSSGLRPRGQHERRSFRLGLGRQRARTPAAETRFTQHLRERFRVEAQARLSHLPLKVLTIVAQQV